MKKLLLSALAAATIISSSAAVSQPEPKRELRSVWFTTYLNIDWPLASSRGTTAAAQAKIKAEAIKYIEDHKRRNYNGICVQTRSMADAIYKSSYEPWSEYITGKRGADPGWDPLAFVVEECHKRGLECWVWINPYRQNRGGVRNTDFDNQWKQNDWLITWNNYTVFNPALEETRKHNLDVMREIYMNYAIDGMIFDDYFYPNGIPYHANDANTAPDWDDYKEQCPDGRPEDINDWRRENVAKFLRELSAQVKQDRPDMRFGIGPAGIAKHGAKKWGVEPPAISGNDWQYDDIASDPVQWLAEGTIDFIAPQLYWFYKPSSNSYTSVAPYDILTKWWSETAAHFGRHNYISHGAYRMDDGHNDESHWEDLGMQIDFNRKLTVNNAPGSIMYSAKYMDGPVCSGWGDYLQAHNFTRKALVPVIDWKEHPTYDAPSRLSYSNGTLSWNATKNGNAIIRYTVYAVPMNIDMLGAQNADGDGIDAAYMLDVSYATEFTVPADRRSGYWYAVCVYDGYGYESVPATAQYPDGPSQAAVLTAPADGARVDWTATFSWSEVKDAVYGVQIASDADFRHIVYAKNDIVGTSISVSLDDLNAESTYFWRVSTLQPSKLTAYSAVSRFVMPSLVEAPAVTLLTPADAADVRDEFTLTWSAAENVEKYTVEIADDASFSGIRRATEVAAPSTSLRVLASTLGLGTYHWRVKAEGRRFTPSVSASRSFTISHIDIGLLEPGYQIKTDPATYAPADKITIENLWMRSTGAPFSNIAFESNGALNRGMAIHGDYVYVSGRDEASSASHTYLRRYSLLTGERASDLRLGADSEKAFLPCNDVFKDTGGNLLISNLILNSASSPLYIHLVDTETGDVREVAALTCTSDLGRRIDFANVYGDVVKDKTFYVFAAFASGNGIVRWTITDGAETECVVKKISEFVPSSADNFNIAPRIYPVSATEVIVDGFGTVPVRYDFTTGKIIDSVSLSAEMKPVVNSNGFTSFVLNGNHYQVYVKDDYTTEGYNYLLGTSGKEFSLGKISPLWTLPEGRLGNLSSSSMSNPVDSKITAPGEALICIYAPGNGLALYRMTDGNVGGVENVAIGDAPVFRIDGRTVIFSESVGSAALYTPAGVELFRGDDVRTLEVGQAGMYILLYDGKAERIVVK